MDSSRKRLILVIVIHPRASFFYSLPCSSRPTKSTSLRSPSGTFSFLWAAGSERLAC